jgi:NTP pyrophosphatase (non-canonical NTP hydrolase)
MHFLQELRAANKARNDEWQNVGKPFSLVFWANELAGEAGETCNILKKLDREHNYQVRGSRATLAALTEELSDVVICCDLTGMFLDVEFSPELCWPNKTFTPRPDHPYSELGAKIARAVGRVNGMALHYDTHIGPAQITGALMETLFETRSAAEQLGIKLEHHVTVKFNMTSEKIGLATRL